MKVNLKWIRNYERLVNKYRHLKVNGVEDRHDIHVSKAQHPSRPRSVHRANASLEENYNRRVEL